jgi:predicted nuclease of predicted toxin-antitoxin system
LRLLLDEHFSPEIARQLRARGHDVVAVKERKDLESRSDRVHFATMADQRRAIVTQDLGDFRPLLTEVMRAGMETYGLICVSSKFPLNKRAIGAAIRALEHLLELYPSDDSLTKGGGEGWMADEAIQA